ncbi:hypothetical protein [Tychonema sp. LEGE 07203]|uniref:hypothetical protein n=1 Tax=Tychonema sp. LEGE 07203 TaxID=1828671 RepID=UPI0018824828|nr:hypothetical protein [Tychonema sp. LEGE 07203]MBE9094379.1 hypothetical protein [Tychonema sp. LEGE 07203]
MSIMPALLAILQEVLIIFQKFNILGKFYAQEGGERDVSFDRPAEENIKLS